MLSLWQRLYDLENKVYNQSGSQIKQYTVSYLEDLDSLYSAPPAIAYVKETGEYYRKFNVEPDIYKTPYFSGRNGWFSLDVSTPRFDRQIHIINHRWVTVENYTQDLDYYNTKAIGSGIWPNGIPQEIMDSMPVPEPSSNVEVIHDALPGDLVFRIGREDESDPESELNADNNKWYIISTEVLDHGDDSHHN